MDRDPQDTAIVRTILDLGANLGLTVTAEGIETVEVWEELARLGCALGQGYYLSRPLAADDFEAWLGARNPSDCAALGPLFADQLRQARLLA
jgi:EAL domain-containing protein (putative c-di-GMP-specific phosphodiesterase class I)